MFDGACKFRETFNKKDRSKSYQPTYYVHANVRLSPVLSFGVIARYATAC